MPLALIHQALIALFLIAIGTPPAQAQGVLPVPELTARVMDQTGTLGAEQRQALEQKLADFERAKGTQIVVLMVPTTAPEDIAAYANRVGNTWKIGRKDVGDGLLVVIAKGDRSMRIEVAKALEGAVPDIAAAQILDQQMKPAFRQGDFAGGIGAALDQLIARVSGEPLPAVDAVHAEERGGLIENPLLSIAAIVLGGGILGPFTGALGFIVPRRWRAVQLGLVPLLGGAVNATVAYDSVNNLGAEVAALVGLASALAAWYLLHTQGDAFDTPARSAAKGRRA